MKAVEDNNAVIDAEDRSDRNGAGATLGGWALRSPQSHLPRERRRGLPARGSQPPELLTRLKSGDFGESGGSFTGDVPFQ